MAFFLAVIESPGLTAEQYDAVIASMGVERRPSGGIYLHIAAPTADGFHIVELWDDQQGFERFLQERMAPAAEELGLSDEPVVTVTPVHNLFAPRLDEIGAFKKGSE